jgi:hypothetical protein
LWRRRESNTGPVIIAEHVGAIRSVDSGEESGACEDAGGVANASDDAGTSRACSSVASWSTPAALLEAIDAAIAALEAGETDIARARLHALAEAVRAKCHAAEEHGV